MFRLGLLIRALPAIVGELVSLIWYSYRTGDRSTAAAALVWLTSLVALSSFALNGALTALDGGEVQLKGPVIAAALPLSMWVARQLLSILLTSVGRLLVALGREPIDVPS